MIGRNVARLLVTVGLLCASVSWTGWVVLHTVADPSRSTKIAHEVLDDPVARDQIAGDLASSLAQAVNTAAAAAATGTGVKVPKIDGSDPALRSAVVAALGDARVTTNLTDAFAAEHANLLGVEPKQVAAIDTALLVDVVSRALGVANPKFAAQLTAAAPKSIALPDVEIPFIASARRFATAAVPRLALAALALIGVAFLAGDRPQVLRRAGAWAFGAGLMWVIVPRGVIWASDKWAPGNAAVVRAVLHGATGVVTALATLLLLGGASMFAVGAVLGHVASNSRDTRDTRDGRAGRAGRGEQRLTPGWRSFTGREMPSSAPSSASARFDQHA